MASKLRFSATQSSFSDSGNLEDHRRLHIECDDTKCTVDGDEKTIRQLREALFLKDEAEDDEGD